MDTANIQTRNTERAAQPPQNTHNTLDVAATAPGAIRVIRRNGKVTGFDASKINIAVTKAFLAVEGGPAAASARVRETVKQVTEQVVQALTRHMSGGGTLHIEDIHNTFTIGRHGGRLDLQPEICKCLGQPVKQSRKVTSIDFDDGMGRADPVREDHPRRHRQAPHPRLGRSPNGRGGRGLRRAHGECRRGECGVVAQPAAQSVVGEQA